MIYYYFKSESNCCGEESYAILEFKKEPDEFDLDDIGNQLATENGESFYCCDLDEEEFECYEDYESDAEQDEADYFESCFSTYRKITKDDYEFDVSLVQQAF